MSSTSMNDAKPHKILVDFHGSQTGNDRHFFKAGDISLLTPHLAEVAVAAGQAAPASEKEYLASVVAPVAGLEEPIPEGSADEAQPLAEDRETKVAVVEETKPDAKKPGGKKKAA